MLTAVKPHSIFKLKPKSSCLTKTLVALALQNMSHKFIFKHNETLKTVAVTVIIIFVQVVSVFEGTK